MSVLNRMNSDTLRKSLLAMAAAIVLLLAGNSPAQQPRAPAAGSATAAGDMADFFSQVGDQIYEDCIFELSQEQIEVQHALMDAYIKHGATSAAARQLAVKQIEPPKFPTSASRSEASRKPHLQTGPPRPPPQKAADREALPKIPPASPAPTAPLADKKMLPQWDCAPDIDYVTIQHKGYERKLTGGEICNPFEDVVRKVPDR